MPARAADERRRRLVVDPKVLRDHIGAVVHAIEDLELDADGAHIAPGERWGRQIGVLGIESEGVITCAAETGDGCIAAGPATGQRGAAGQRVPGGAAVVAVHEVAQGDVLQLDIGGFPVDGDDAVAVPALVDLARGDDVGSGEAADRRVVDRGDGEINGGEIGDRPQLITHRVGEAVGAVEVQVWRVGHDACHRVDAQRTLRWRGDDRYRCRIDHIVGVGIVGQQVDDHRDLFGGDDRRHRAAVVVGHRRIVDCGDVDEDGSHI